MGHLFGIYFGVPDGAVWGNVVAEPVCVALAGIVAFLLRHKIGHALAGWWHHHSQQHRAEQEEHHQRQLDEMEARLHQHINDTLARGE